MRSQMGGINAAFKADKLRSVIGNSGKINSELEEKIIEWNTLFRRNWDIFAEFYLGVPLKPYQRQALHEIGVSDTFFWRAGRGGSKSFITSLAAICKLLLYPNCQIVITSSTIDQANKMVKEKIERELIKKLSLILLYYFENDWIKITKPNDGYYVECTLNNSTITVLAPVESARGSRSNFTVYDEVAIMKKSSLDQIFDGMLFPRQPNYLSKPEYAGKKRWLEESKSIYLTSSKFKFQWWYKLWTDCVTGYYTDKKSRYGVFATDFFDNIDNGLKTWGDYRRAKRQNDDMSFRMEYLNEAIGNAENAFYRLQDFKNNQIIEHSFIAPTEIDLYTLKNLGNAQKKEDEIRLVVTDYAFANTTSAQKNDNTIILLMSLHWKGNRFERHVDYIESHSAGDSLGAADRARELFWDYQADYFIPDIRSGGETLFNRMTMPWDLQKALGNRKTCGLTVSSEMDLQVVPDNKIQDLVDRTVDKKALPCIIPMIGTADLNATMWVELKKQLESNNIKFLISCQDKQAQFEDSGQYFDMTSEEYAQAMIPYGQVEMLITEAINLSAEFKEGRVKLKEPRSMTKDRAVCLSYGNYIASKIENKYNQSYYDEEIDYNNIQLVW